MDAAETPRHGRALARLCYAVAAGVLTQAVLAGLFLSGVADARMAHLIVGWLLPHFALTVAVVGVGARAPRRVGRVPARSPVTPKATISGS